MILKAFLAVLVILAPFAAQADGTCYALKRTENSMLGMELNKICVSETHRNLPKGGKVWVALSYIQGVSMQATAQLDEAKDEGSKLRQRLWWAEGCSGQIWIELVVDENDRLNQVRYAGYTYDAL